MLEWGQSRDNANHGIAQSLSKLVRGSHDLRQKIGCLQDILDDRESFSTVAVEQPLVPDTLARIIKAGGVLHASSQIDASSSSGDSIRLALSNGEQIDCALAIVQIGFLASKETFERLAVRLNDDGSIAIDPYFETSRRGIFAVGDVHGEIKLITVAWAEGIQAAIHAFKEITSPYWLNEKRLHDNKIALMGDKISYAAKARRKVSP